MHTIILLLIVGVALMLAHKAEKKKEVLPPQRIPKRLWRENDGIITSADHLQWREHIRNELKSTHLNNLKSHKL